MQSACAVSYCHVWPVRPIPVFSTLSHKRHDFRITAFENKMFILIFSTKVHYRIHKCSSPVPILSHINPVHTPTSHFPRTHLNIILPSKPGSSKWSLPHRFPYQNLLYTSPLPHTCCMPRLPHYSPFDHPKNIG